MCVCVRAQAALGVATCRLTQQLLQPPQRPLDLFTTLSASSSKHPSVCQSVRGEEAAVSLQQINTG